MVWALVELLVMPFTPTVSAEPPTVKLPAPLLNVRLRMDNAESALGERRVLPATCTAEVPALVGAMAGLPLVLSLQMLPVSPSPLQPNCAAASVPKPDPEKTASQHR